MPCGRSRGWSRPWPSSGSRVSIRKRHLRRLAYHLSATGEDKNRPKGWCRIFAISDVGTWASKMRRRRCTSTMEPRC